MCLMICSCKLSNLFDSSYLFSVHQMEMFSSSDEIDVSTEENFPSVRSGDEESFSSKGIS